MVGYLVGLYKDLLVFFFLVCVNIDSGDFVCCGLSDFNRVLCEVLGCCFIFESYVC